MEHNITISQPSSLEALNRSEIDVQIATAKMYPRDIHSSLLRIQQLATMDADTAAECFYVLYRNGGSAPIEGISVRLAEIIAESWGNLRVQTRIVANDGKTITAQGVCHDLETNYAACVEVKRRITDKYGKTYSEDMQVVTGNAASAIAFRNAVCKVVPKAVTKKVIDEVKKVSLGAALDLTTTINNMFANFAKLGVSEKELLDLMDLKSREQITNETVFTLRGIFQAIKEGTTTVKEAIKDVLAEKAAAQQIQSKAAQIKSKISAGRKGRASQPAQVEAPAQQEAAPVMMMGDVMPEDRDAVDRVYEGSLLPEEQ